MTHIQQQILDIIIDKLAQKGIRRFVYCSEYLGYLPFGQYHWINCGGEDISNDLPFNFSSDDLTELENLGKINMVDKWINPKDDLESKTTYELS